MENKKSYQNKNSSNKKRSKLSRREFIRITGQAALGLAIASHFGCAEGSNGVSESAWRDLQSSLQGMLLRPGDEAYPRTALPWNLDYTDIRPQAIVLAANPFDVQTSVRFAREHGLPAVARSGKHSYAAYSSTTGLTIDLSLMNSINVDSSDGIVDIAAGAPLGSVADATAPFKLVVPAGHCASVGVAGLLLGGGFGYNGRKFGLTSDNLV